jgi:tRNA1(Val) A37 N6-methylase TrmN6
MEKPSVAIVHYSCPPVIGGVESVIRSHALLMADNGYKVRIIAGKGERFRDDIDVVIVPSISSGSREVKTILDFSAGWGDRLAGFYASETGEYYLGIDPRKENHSIYEEQAKFYSEHLGFFEHEKKSDFICEPAEDVDLSKYENFFDIAFTSPPYFNVERYSYDDTQSWVRYKTLMIGINYFYRSR